MTTKINFNQIKGSPSNIMDYGAATTASAATNLAAINAALAANQSVYVPEGVFTTTPGIFMNSGNRLYGPGTLKTTVTTSAYTITTATDATDLVIDGITFDGPSGVNVFAITTKGVNGLSVMNCTCKEIKLIDCDVGTGFSQAVAGKTGCNRNISIINNKGNLTGTSGDGTSSVPCIWVHFCWDFVVEGNVFDGYNDFINVWGGNWGTDAHAATDPHKAGEGSITGNVGTNCINAGIWTSMAQDVVIGNNFVSGVAASVEAYDAEASLRISFENNSSYAFGVSVNLASVNADIVFTGNTFSVKDTGVHLRATNQFDIDGAAPDPTCGSITLRGNTFRVIGATGCSQFGNGDYAQIIVDGNTLENVYCWFTHYASAKLGQLIFTNNNIRNSFDNGGVDLQIGYSTTSIYDVAPFCDHVVSGNVFMSTIGAGTANIAIQTIQQNSAMTCLIENNKFLNYQNAGTGIGIVSASVQTNFIIRGNTFDADTVYTTNSAPNKIVLWQDNYSIACTDAIGASPNSATQYYSVGSRVWKNAPAAGSEPGWICTTAGLGGGGTAVFKAMANLAA